MRKWIAVTVFVVAASLQATEPSTDQTQIEKLMRSVWDRPDAPMIVQPISVVDDYAIAGWQQDTKGGRALLHRAEKGQWKVAGCGGKTIQEIGSLKSLGVPEATALKLLEMENAAEKTLPADVRKRLGSFNGLIKH